ARATRTRSASARTAATRAPPTAAAAAGRPGTERRQERTTMRRCYRLAVALFTLTALPAAEKTPYDPVEQYAERQVEGWRVLVNKRLLQEESRELCDRTLKLLGDHLYRVARVVPAGPLARLRKVPIWVE